jgi:flavin reductase (DIM6/NTAB) family NADH-FMN oxidoreductase RutF
MSAAVPACAVDPSALRRAASRFPTGVALVTAPGGLALVIDSFVSVSLVPPLVAFTVSRTSLTWRRMRKTGRFGVSVLGARHAEDIRDRARPGADRLTGLDVDVLDGVPIVSDALAGLVCTIQAEHGAGDHSVVIGHVDRLCHGGGEPPLVFYGGAFGTVSM